MREFNELTKRKLPYDVVFLLNQYFSAVGNAIRTQGGTIDKFMGDGVLAVFGQRQGVEAGCRQALRTIRAVDLALDHINSVLAPELGKPIQIAAGLHVGPMILGRVGFGDAVDLTFIGTAVKAALALEQIAKERDVQLVLSYEAARNAGWLPGRDSLTEVTVAGIAEPLEVVNVPRGRDLAVSILAPTPNEGRPPTGQPPGRSQPTAPRVGA